MPVNRNGRKSIMRVTILIIVLLLIIQLTPSTAFDDECLKDYEQNSKARFLSVALHPDISFINKDNRNTVFLKLAPKCNTSFIQAFYCADILFTHSFYNEALVDYRKEIKQAIPHYFHGSKYKSMYLSI